jgi:outer membrane protein
MRILLLFLSLFVANQALFSQQKWTLQECVEEALDKNINIQQARLQIQQASNNRDGAWANLFPNLEFDAGYFWNFGFNIDPVTNLPTTANRQTSSFNLSSNWVLFDGLQNVNQLARSRLEFMGALYNLEAIQNDVTLNVTNAYIQILLNKELLRVAEEQVKVTVLQEARISKLVKAGSLPQGDLYQLQAQLARNEQNLVTAKNNLTISLLVLGQILLIDDLANFDIVEPVNDLPPATYLMLSPDDIYNEAVNVQPIIKQRTMQRETAEKDFQIARGAYLPSLFLVGRINTNFSDQIPLFEPFMTPGGVIGQTESGENVFSQPGLSIRPSGENKPFSDQWNDNINQFVGVSMRVPIFSRLQIRNNARRAEIGIRNADLGLEQTRQELRQTIQRAHADALAARNTYDAADKSVKANKEAFDYAERRFEVGAINQVEYETARNNLTQAESEKARAKYEFTFRIKVLEFYVSNRITF